MSINKVMVVAAVKQIVPTARTSRVAYRGRS